jgi:hypothetical protein
MCVGRRFAELEIETFVARVSGVLCYIKGTLFLTRLYLKMQVTHLRSFLHGVQFKEDETGMTIRRFGKVNNALNISVAKTEARDRFRRLNHE